MPGKQRNSGKNVNGTTTKGPSNDELERFVDRVETLEQEKRAITSSILDVLVEAMDRGHNKKAIREVVRRRLETTEEKAKRISYEDALDAMMSRLGMLAGTPLGEAAVVHLHTPQQ